MWTRKSCAGWVMLAALASLSPLVGCRSGRDYHGEADGCCGKKSSGSSLVSASAAPAYAKHLGGGLDGKPAATATSPPAEGLYGGQRTCPVTGEALGNMGPPIPVTLSGQTVYLCCRACVTKVQRDPDKYLTIVQAERAAR